MNNNIFCSWSGGKDSCLSLFKAIGNGYSPKALVTMMIEDGKYSRAHKLSKAVLKKQANAIGLPIIMRPTSWENYEHTFSEVIKELKQDGIKKGVFGDIDLQEHWDWVEKLAANNDISFLEPLWKMERDAVIKEFIENGFKAIIIAVKEEVLVKKYLGQELSLKLLEELKKEGIDTAGEEGEYHTFVYAGPIFSKQVEFVLGGEKIIDGYRFLDIL